MPDLDPFSNLWTDAVAEYERQTDRNLEKDSVFKQFRTIEDFENAIGNRKEQFSGFRDEYRKFYSRLAECITPMQPILLLVQKGLAYDGIEEVFEQVGDITARLKEYEPRSLESSLKSKMTDILAFILEILGRAEVVVRRGRIKQWARSVLVKDNDIDSAVKRLQRYVGTELGLVIALTYGRVKDVQTTITDVQADVKVLKAGMNDVLAIQRNDRQRALSEEDEKRLAEALRTETISEVAQVHAANIEKLTKGTGAWIRDDVMFQAWEQEKAPILWVFGKPGVGKTMLAARTIETLQNKYPQHPDIPSLTSVSYFYWKDDNPHLRDCGQMWKAAALQITKANDRYKKHVVATIKNGQDTFASARRTWQQLFLDFFKEDTSSRSLTSLAFIIVDGLDEAPPKERSSFLSCLTELVKVGAKSPESKCRIQVAVFARPDVRADPGFENVGFKRQERIIEVTPARNTIDIEAYIRKRLSDVDVLRILRSRKATKEYQVLAKQIYNSVLTRSQGMFLWASLVFDQIWNSPSPEAIGESLHEAPEGLDDMLHHVFRRLDIEEAMRRSYLSELLSWVFCTYRPLSMAELFVLLLMTANQHCIMLDKDLTARYSSIFTMTGQLEDDESDKVEDDGEASEDLASDDDDFDFLKDDPPRTDIQDDENEKPETNDNDARDSEDTEFLGQSDKEAAQEVFDMPRAWYTTTVTFSHARIRDYLTTEGDPSTRHWFDCQVVPENMNLKHLDIALACIQVLRTNTADHYSLYSLTTYAVVNWMKHLEQVNFTKISQPRKVQAARLLSKLFHNGEALLRTTDGLENVFIETWFGTDKYSSLVRKVIADNIADIDENESDWAITVKESARALFKPLIAACARKWLTKEGWDDPDYLDKSEPQVWMMCAFSTLDDEGANGGSIDSFNVSYGMWNIPLEMTETVAGLEPVPKSEHWYTGVAWILMEADEDAYTARAIEYFNKALELKPGGWVAMEGLARCYGENLHEYEAAVRWAEDTIHNLPQTGDFDDVPFLLQTRISGWKLYLGKDQEAFEIAQKAYQNSRQITYGTGTAFDSSILQSIKHYVDALYRTKEYTEITRLLYQLDTQATFEGNRSLWVVFLRAQCEPDYNVGVFEKVGAIVRENVDSALETFMHDSIKKSVELNSDTVSQTQSVWLATEAAHWQYSYAHQPELSIELWENLVTLIDQSDEAVKQRQASYRTQASEFLSEMYFKAAKTAYHNGTDPQSTKRYYRASYPALILGLWLREYAKADEETWRACIKPSIKQALYLLSDEDPWNDQRAYAQLGQALLLAGDTLNASIALGITTKPLAEVYQSNKAVSTVEETHDEFSDGELISTAPVVENQQPNKDPDEPGSTSLQVGQFGGADHNTVGVEEFDHDGPEESGSQDVGEAAATEEEAEEDEEPINPKYAGFQCLWTCDGPCQTPNTSYAALYFCRVCHDVCFCEVCVELVKSDNLPFRRCASDHPHVKVFPMIEQAEQITEALVDMRFEPQQEWLESLRKVWDAE